MQRLSIQGAYIRTGQKYEWLVQFFFVARPVFFLQKLVARPIFRINICSAYFVEIKKKCWPVLKITEKVSPIQLWKKRILARPYIRPPVITIFFTKIYFLPLSKRNGTFIFSDPITILLSTRSPISDSKFESLKL